MLVTRGAQRVNQPEPWLAKLKSYVLFKIYWHKFVPYHMWFRMDNVIRARMNNPEIRINFFACNCEKKRLF